MLKFSWLAAFSLFASSVTSAVASTPLAQFTDEFHQEFLQKMQKSKIPGGVYVIVQGDKIVRIGTYGVRSVDSKAKVDANTIFRLASVSKTFAGGLATQIQHEGRFSWDDRVTKYVPGFSFRSTAMTNQLKIEHLIAQNAGVSSNAFDDLIETNKTPAQILPKFREINPRCQPGKCYGYQNVLFSMIESVLLKTTGMTYERLLEQRIFKPLQMHTASVGYSAFLANKNRAMPHISTKRGWAETKVLPSYYRVNPAAGVNASAMDMGKWLIARLGHRPAVFTPAMLNDMHRPRIETAENLQGRTYGAYVREAEYSLGLRVYQFGQHQLYHHGGLVRGYRTDLSYSVEKDLGIVVLVNAQSNVVAELASFFWSRMLNVPAETPPPVKKKTQTKKKKVVKKPVKRTH